jgi:hypothetical protein
MRIGEKTPNLVNPNRGVKKRAKFPASLLKQVKHTVEVSVGSVCEAIAKFCGFRHNEWPYARLTVSSEQATARVKQVGLGALARQLCVALDQRLQNSLVIFRRVLMERQLAYSVRSRVRPMMRAISTSSAL